MVAPASRCPGSAVRACPSASLWPVPRALIVGVGIGGLAAGIALRKAGWDVRIFERAPVPREIGFGIGLAPNAVAALRELGVAEAVLARAATPLRGEIRHPDGRPIRRIAADATRFRNAQLMRMVQRPVLHRALLDAVGPERVEADRRASAFESDASSVAVRFTNGSVESGDLLIGADGVHSTVRSQIHNAEPPPQSSGYISLRGTSPAVAALDGMQGIWWLGLRIECGAVQSGPDTVYWFLALHKDDVGTELHDTGALRARVIARLDPQFKRIAQVSSPDQMRVDELFERPPLRRWGQGRVTLLGDAAHPVLPHTGQGAAQALEDAVGLGRALRGSGDPVAALRFYEQVRSRRTAAIVRSGPRIARITTASSRTISTVRNTAIRLFPAAVVSILLMRPASDPNRKLGPPLS